MSPLPGTATVSFGATGNCVTLPPMRDSIAHLRARREGLEAELLATREAYGAKPRQPATTSADTPRIIRSDWRGRVALWTTIALCALGSCGGLGWYEDDSRVARVALSAWNRAAPLICDHEDWNLESLHIETTSGTALQANKCNIRIREVDLRAPVALNIGGESNISFQHGTIESCIAARAHGSSHADLGDVKVIGRLQAEHESGGSISGEPGGLGPQSIHGIRCFDVAPAAPEQVAARACDGVVECYRDSRVLGSVWGELLTRVDADGRVLGADLKGEPPASVRECLLKRGRELPIMGGSGAGTMSCAWAGTLGPNGTEQIERKPSFVR